jgi:hypothetical protein
MRHSVVQAELGSKPESLNKQPSIAGTRKKGLISNMLLRAHGSSLFPKQSLSARLTV